MGQPSLQPSTGFAAPAKTSSQGAAVARIAALLVQRARPGQPLIVGVAGEKIDGRSALCAALAARLKHTRAIETIEGESLLLPNSELAARGLLDRKGAPETYNTVLASGLLQRVRWGAVEIPGYSPADDDIRDSLSRTIDRPDILLIDGFNCITDQRHSLAGVLDLLMFVGADEDEPAEPHLALARQRAEIVVQATGRGFML